MMTFNWQGKESLGAPQKASVNAEQSDQQKAWQTYEESPRMRKMRQEIRGFGKQTPLQRL
jgi:hypothetical protein